MIKWHRLFGLTLKDFFTGTSYSVDLEKDLSFKQQLLDVVIIENGGGERPEELPDGLENLTIHNLLTYKSHQEGLDGWTLNELIGHYVNYRKQISPSTDELLPDTEFQLYAVSARFPQKLDSEYKLIQVKQGVYDILWGDHNVRIIVLSRVSKEARNAIWHLFSADTESVKYGASNYQWRMSDISAIINELFKKYRIEGIAMPYTIDDFKRDYAREYMDKLPLEDRIKGLKEEELIEILKMSISTLPPEKIESILKEIRKKNGIEN